jgi:hypothetical protein
MHEGYFRLEARSLRTTIRRPVSLSPVGADTGSVTIDLHTKTALIGRHDLDVTLDFIRLDEEVTNGYVDIYAVTRELETVEHEDTFEVGKEALYRLANCWVSSSKNTLMIETSRFHLHGLGLRLSSLRFTGLCLLI